MTVIRCGDHDVQVHTELSDRAGGNGQHHTVYLPECCSARYPSLKVLAISHMNGCPRDREIQQLLDGDAQ